MDVEDLKDTMKSFISSRDQSEMWRKSVDEIKADIKLLTATNKELTEKINDLEDDSYEEDDSFNGTRFELKQYGDKLYEIPPDLKCGECDFVGNAVMSLKKHRNTKHVVSYDESAKGSPNYNRDFIVEGIEDMFQMEILDGEEVYACKICDEGFDPDDKVKRHLEINHNDILIQIRINLDRENKNNSDKSFGKAWLA